MISEGVSNTKNLTPITVIPTSPSLTDGWLVGPSPIGWWWPDQPTIHSPVIQVAFPVLLPFLAHCNLKITNSHFTLVRQGHALR